MKNSLPCNSVLTLSGNYKINFIPPNIIPLTSDMIREELRKKDYGRHEDAIFKLPYLYNFTVPFIFKIYDIKQELVIKDKVELVINGHGFYYHIGNEDEKSRARKMIIAIIEGAKTWGDLYLISDDSGEGSKTMIEEKTKI